MLLSASVLVTIVKIFMNTIFVSTPRCLFIVMFTLIVAGEFDYWKQNEYKNIFYKWDFTRVVIPAVIAALVSNIVNYFNIQEFWNYTAVMAALFISIILTSDIIGDSNSLVWSGKILLNMIMAFAISAFVEVLYIPWLIIYADITHEIIFSNVLYNFLIALPAFLTEFFVIFVLITKILK